MFRHRACHFNILAWRSVIWPLCAIDEICGMDRICTKGILILMEVVKHPVDSLAGAKISSEALISLLCSIDVDIKGSAEQSISDL